ncbi:HAMP domain-containing protein [Paenibacillus psychroresistens]|uniref:HAMP domain-containing protein n=1 Tax=Paenibacillus psychroresistens TaxID=1778678 RepID=A0A6B8RHS9_9BACL|nr:histidine kinase [Paenibacillus psychroresistens]QGQ95112.1 HAMP domain-containing protein [Paenibacillus psychroresistens]
MYVLLAKGSVLTMVQLFRNSFYRRIQISFLILILLPTIIVSFINYFNTQKSVKEKIELSNKSLLMVMSKDITRMVDDLTYASNFFVQDSNVRSRLKDFKSIKQIESFSDLRTYLDIKEFFNLVAAKTMNTDIIMFLANNAGFIVQSTEGDVILPGEIRRNWEAATARVDPLKPTLLQWIGTFQSDANHTSLNYLAARVIHDSTNDELLATLYILIPQIYFRKLFDQVPTGSFTLFNNDGQRIAGNATSSYESEKASTSFIRNEMVIPKTGWKLVYETSNLEITGEISRTFYWSLMLVIPLFIVFSVLSLFTARSLHRPIRKLQLGVKQFGNGALNIRFQTDGNDEIADLGRTLNVMLDQIHKLFAEIEREQEQKRILELQALFAQIRPHFLLNTLNSIKCNLVLNDDLVHSQKIDSLMSLLRSYLKFNEQDSLQSECSLLAHYIEIMKMRIDISLVFEVELDPNYTEFEVPKLLLQPLVENAFVHGFSEEITDPRIQIRSEFGEGKLIIRVSDNGIGMSLDRLNEINTILRHSNQEEVSSINKRVGILNVQQRLQITYGADAHMFLESNEFGGVTVILGIPVRRGL